MKRKELTKTFMVYTEIKNISALKGLTSPEMTTPQAVNVNIIPDNYQLYKRHIGKRI